MNPIATKCYRILVADDHTIVRIGVRALIEKQPGLEVCAETSTGPETLAEVRKVKPDLVILDLAMPELNGLDVARTVREENPETDVLVLSQHFSEELAREVLRAGALGYVLKSDAESDLLAAIDNARHRQPFFTSQLATSMMQSFVKDTGAGNGSGLERLPLTPRELSVIQLLAEGKSNKQVAAALNISTRTVESHRNNIMHKMNFASITDLVKFAVRHNLAEL
jgi:DNA-binding NarL/FixJ family response regulator